MKKILLVLISLILGALLMYFFLWYQVLGKFTRVWCQIYTAGITIEEAEVCKNK